MDHSSVFIHNGPNGVTRTRDRSKSEEVKTQIERAAEDLKIDIIYARSPQAKGRI